MTTLLGGKYVLDRRLGGGGMAEVYFGRTVGTAGFSRDVAIKRVLPGYSNDARFVELFVAEARLSSQLRHPNIVSVLDFDQDAEGRLFLVMELVDGTDLDGLIATGPLPFSVMIFVIAEVLRGLGYAHELPPGADGVRGLVHRDVSPHNVLLSWQGEVRVSDFGIAKARAATAASASAMIKGKPAYMSPEQANGEPLDGTSDLFAVGVMLWELLCGRPLFASDSIESTLARVLFAPIVRPSELRADAPADLERVALRLLERDRARRYPRAQDAIDELLACRDCPRDGRDALAAVLAERFPGRAPLLLRGVSTTSPDAVTLAPPSSSSPQTPSRPLPGPAAPAVPTPAFASPPRRRRPSWGIAAALVIAAALAVVAILVATRDAAAPAPAAPAPALADPAAVAPPAAPAAPVAPAAAPGHSAASDATVSEVEPPAAAGSAAVESSTPKSKRRGSPPVRERGERPGIQEIQLGSPSK